MLNSRASDSLFRRLAKTLVKLLKLKTGKLNKRKSAIRVEIFSDANDEPPAHWLEKVAKGAPHLLVQPDESPLNSAPDNLYLRVEVKSTPYSKEKDGVTAQSAGNNTVDSVEDKPRVIKKLDKQPVAKTVYEAVRNIKKYFSQAEKEVDSYVDHIQQTRQSHQQNRTTEGVLNAQTKFKNPDKSDEDIIRPTLKTAILTNNINAEFFKAKARADTSANRVSKENKAPVAAKYEQVLNNNRRSNQNPVHLYPNSKVCGNSIQKQQDSDTANKPNKARRAVAHDNSSILHRGYFKKANGVESPNQGRLNICTTIASYFENSFVDQQYQSIAHETVSEKPHADQSLFDRDIVDQPGHTETHTDTGWFNLPKDRINQTVHDPWPTLPDEDTSYLANKDGSSTNIYKILFDNKHTYRSDKEQRSHLWNG